jgi:hypothetical protein
MNRNFLRCFNSKFDLTILDSNYDDFDVITDVDGFMNIPFETEHPASPFPITDVLKCDNYLSMCKVSFSDIYPIEKTQ